MIRFHCIQINPLHSLISNLERCLLMVQVESSIKNIIAYLKNVPDGTRVTKTIL